MYSKRLYPLLAILLALSFNITNAQVRLPAFVSDHMIIQRDARVKIWGWAAAGEEVSVKFRGKSYKTKADAKGNWNVLLAASKAGGPFPMEIKGTNSITINDILVGEVWLCSGQSNMQHAFMQHLDYFATEIAGANSQQIREFKVGIAPNLVSPSNDVRGEWMTATSEHIKKFSVVGYFFAKKLHRELNVPVGIINASVGGTPIEAWTSEEGLKEFPDFTEALQKHKDTAWVNSTNREVRLKNRDREQRNNIDQGITDSPKWYEPAYDAKTWRPINIPGFWEDQGLRDLDGIVWYRRTIEVPASMADKEAIVYLGRIVDADFLYINGKPAGNTGYQYPQRRYVIPAGTLKPGKNIVVVRVINSWGKGGFVADKPYFIKAGTDTVDLRGEWHYKVGKVYTSEDRLIPGISAQNQPASLYNGMIAPLVGYTIKGFAWYQGESNINRAKDYRRFLPALIADWRTKWKSDLTFVFAQLPGFMDYDYSPGESQWAVFRESQFKTLRVPKTAMAVAIDAGDWNDIHPDNKQPVGERLALGALRVAYGKQDLVHSGPLYDTFNIEGNKVVVSFTSTGSGLSTKDGDRPMGFAIAGSDKKFVWAETAIKGNAVEVWSEKVPQPMYVRYAWADNPPHANLINKEGLPASPFRTDE